MLINHYNPVFLHNTKIQEVQLRRKDAAASASTVAVYCAIIDGTVQGSFPQAATTLVLTS
jgi:hypothetical protein